MISEARLLDYKPNGFRPAATRPALKPLSQVRYEHIMAAIDAAGGNLTEAASLIGISRRTIERTLATRWPFLRRAA